MKVPLANRLEPNSDYRRAWRFSSRYFKNTALFKKRTLNKKGRIQIPIEDGRALDLGPDGRGSLVMSPIFESGVYKFRAVTYTQREDGSWAVQIPRDSVESLASPLPSLAPAQFWFRKSEYGKRPLTQLFDEDQVLKERLAINWPKNRIVYKSHVREDDNLGFNIKVEQNEREIFGLEAGESLRVAVFGVEKTGTFDIRNAAVGNSIEMVTGTGSLRMRLPTQNFNITKLLGRDSYQEGDIVQVIAGGREPRRQ